MAIIPKAQRSVTEFQNIPSSALRRDTATPEQFGAQEARTLQQTGAALQQFASPGVSNFINESIQGKKNKKDAFMRDNVNQYDQDLIKYNSSVFERKNADAVDSYEQSRKFYQELKNKYSNNFANELDRQRFLGITNSNTQNSLGKIYQHQENERNSYDNLTIEAQNQNFIDLAKQNRFDYKYIKDQESLLMANVAYLNDKNGQTGEVAAKSKENALNNFNVKVVESYGNPSDSIKYLEKNWDSFNPAVRTELKEKFAGESKEVLVRAETLRISTSGLTLEQQLAEVDKIKEPDVAKVVRQGIKTRDNEKQAIRKSEKDAFEEDEWDKLFANPTAYNIPIKDLDSSTQRQMASYQKKASDEANGKGGDIDWVRYSDYKGMSQKDLKKVTVPEILKINDKAKIAEVIKDRAEAIRGKSPEKVERIITIQQQAKLAIQGMSEFDFKKSARTANTNLNKYWEQFDKKIQAIPEQERTVERVSQVKDELLKPITIPKFGFDKTIKAYQMPYLDEDELERAKPKEIPEILKGNDNVEFDAQTGAYYLDYNEFREVYDINGKLIGKRKFK